MTMMKRIFLAAVLGSTALVPATLRAQNPTPPSGPEGSQQSGRAQANQAQKISAADFVNRAAVSSQFEVQSSELAQQKTQNDRIRQFAQRMVRDHKGVGDRLEATAQGIQGVTVPSDLDQRHQQMLQTLQRASGAGFDRNYAQLQVSAHRDAVNLFDQYAQNGDNQQLKQFAQQTLPALREHLQAIQQIQTSLPPAQVGEAEGAGGQQAQQMAQNRPGQDGSRIVVQQTAPTVRVDPADPRVVVRQAQPQVTVNQAQPEIIVRQPQPTVRIDIPQPEIIVRMPEPDVNVAMAQPQVQVDQPQPQVQVMQPQQQPQVQVERTQPQVMVQRSADSEPNVQVRQVEGQPTVRYERAQPRVIVNQAQGQPNVRIERQGEGQQAQAGQPQQQATPASARREYTEEQRRAVRERLSAGDVETTAAVNQNFEMRNMTVGEIEDTNVYNARGDEIGEVDRVIRTPQGRHFLVVGAGGFLGIGRDTVAFPLERFGIRGDRLVIRGVTESDIEAMDDYRDQLDRFQRLDRTARAEMRIWE
jgi:predicted outer membrane protein